MEIDAMTTHGQRLRAIGFAGRIAVPAVPENAPRLRTEERCG
jgi:hypothetical protein